MRGFLSKMADGWKERKEMVEELRDDIAIPSLLLPAFPFPLETCFSGLEILVTLEPINFLGGAKQGVIFIPTLIVGANRILQVWTQ